MGYTAYDFTTPFLFYLLLFEGAPLRLVETLVGRFEQTGRLLLLRAA